MSDKKLNLHEISSSMMELFVQDVLRKNGVTKENRKNLSEEQKAHLKKVVTDLQAQVDEFVKGKKIKVESEEKVELSNQRPLREILKKKKKKK
ncbi:hypothetical protein [Metabacillus sediminilitoris]|uniref:Spore coat protein n=1 Tax=Metabacillus sediminilitoris TaxID=2567941 RepID=A0A4S4C5P7_9BACI|nr:hypothetical protein [Metabacillus sediminilitoris]QGQ47855.1 hypothetical protein GMB29_22900 [Metabacillus sediminilitoris]THF81032.1 hypothetical protein E6W99_07670 [Metabacillus sediminilitoris]